MMQGTGFCQRNDGEISRSEPFRQEITRDGGCFVIQLRVSQDASVPGVNDCLSVRVFLHGIVKKMLNGVHGFPPFLIPASVRRRNHGSAACDSGKRCRRISHRIGCPVQVMDDPFS